MKIAAIVAFCLICLVMVVLLIRRIINLISDPHGFKHRKRKAQSEFDAQMNIDDEWKNFYDQNIKNQ